jgi:hypothetical protein
MSLHYASNQLYSQSFNEDIRPVKTVIEKQKKAADSSAAFQFFKLLLIMVSYPAG